MGYFVGQHKLVMGVNLAGAAVRVWLAERDHLAHEICVRALIKQLFWRHADLGSRGEKWTQKSGHGDK